LKPPVSEFEFSLKKSKSYDDLTEEDLLELESRVCSYGDTVHYAEKPKFFTECERSYLFDMEKKPFLDLQMWYSAVNLGYAN
jgi:4-aminobutyrate aminotransferase/(S)-3-amino-2-methylpropionate transaminase